MSDDAAIRAVLWDQDGVLVNTEPLYFEANREVLARHGVELTDREYAARFLEQAQGLQVILAERGMLDRLEAIRNERDNRYGELLRTECGLLPDAGEALRALHGKVRQCMVTSSYRHNVEAADRRVGFLRYMEFAIAHGDFKESKPSPEPYRKAVARLGIEPASCVAIEDSPRGLAAATAAGIRCLVVPHGLTARYSFGGAWRVFGSLAEATPFLLERVARTDGGNARQ
jgi:HAD superfamily hydrolase (TIGR01509 family)